MHAHGSTRHRPPNFTGWFNTSHRVKPHHSIREAPMRLRNFMPIGLPSITVKHTTCMHVMVFYLITRARLEERPSLPEKLPAQLPKSYWGYRIGCSWAICRPSEIGDTRKITSKRCGLFCSKTGQRIM